jgi:hypothetical protein
MHQRPAASLLRPLGLLVAMLMATFAGLAPAVFANDTPGNNGTVKIHEGNTENDPGEVRNEPHVCTFHLHFYFADPVQAGTWEIQEWAPTGEKGTVVLEGTYDTAGDGEDRQPADGVYTLPDGHYKLFWDGDLDTGKHDKMKVFWVECEAAPAGSEAPASASASVPASASASVPASASASVPASASASASVPASASASVPGGGELPIESASASASTPGGEELPVGGAGSPPTGGVAGIVGTPPAAGTTPPPTDTELAPAGNDQGWRVILIGLAALIAAAVFLVPTPAAARAAQRNERRPPR